MSFFQRLFPAFFLPVSVVQNGRFYRKKGEPKGDFRKEGKERIIFRPGHLLFGGKGMARVLSCRLPLLSLGDGEGPHD